jgi:peroxiredoxin-like protein
VRWDSQRKGSMSSAGLPGLVVATPPEFPGGHAGIWSPEHLFVAAAEACLMTTFLAIAENSKLEFLSYSSEAEGIVEKTEQGLMITEITIRPRIVINDQADEDRARRIIEKAEKNCLVSRSMKTRISLEPDIAVKA